MKESISNKIIETKVLSKFSRYTIYVSSIMILAILTRMYFFEFQLPVNFDAISYFLYSSDIYLTRQFPDEWTPTNNGWPIFVSIFFMIFDSKDALTLMQIQKILSVIISTLVAIPVYFLCKKFVMKKIAIIGVSLIAFEPRLMVNSFLGVTDPLYLLLITTSLALFLQTNKKIVYISFFVVGLATLVRGEGITLFVVLSIMFFIRYREYRFRIIPKYLLVIGIFLIIILPMSSYRIDVIGVDGIFMRSMSSGNELIGEIITGEQTGISKFDAVKLFGMIFVWMMIPNFVVLVPLGIILLLKNRNFEKYTIIVSIIILSLPAFYAYINSVLDTRYFFVLLPIYAILFSIGIEKIVNRLKKSTITILGIIAIIFVTSLIFYDYQKPNEVFEIESFEITKEIFPIVEKKNSKGMLGYFRVIQVVEQWPMEFPKMKIDAKSISVKGYNSLHEFIDNHRSEGLTHIITDDREKEITFLNEVFSENEQIPFLKQVYDSRENNFNYHVKVFEIDYETYDKVNSSD